MKLEKTNPIESLYIHVPFCQHLCTYCDFPKILYFPNFVKGYLKSLKNQLETEVTTLCKTIYLGGGTPSALSLAELDELLKMVKPHVRLQEPYEWTMEVNPETMSIEKMKLLAQFGVNRLSIGVQTFQNHLLKTLGRHHSIQDIKQIVAWANECGITNYSFDFIYGIPGQSLEDISADLQAIKTFKPPHVSLYSLTIEPHTPMYLQGIQEADEDELRKFSDLILDQLRHIGYHRYEVSNFALGRKFESQHNLTYWQAKPYYGIGPGAHGYDGIQRYENLRSFSDYFKGIHHKKMTDLTPHDYEFEYLMLNLRLEEGFLLSQYQSLFNFSFTERFKNPFLKLTQQGYLVNDNGRVHVTDDGMMRLHYVILELTSALD